MNTEAVNTDEVSVSAGSPPTDSEIVAAILGGARDQFSVLMRRHNQRLYRISRSILRDDDAAIDALQEAYIKAFQNLGQLSDGDRVAGWLMRIVRNEALMAKRRRWRETELDDSAAANLVAGEAWMTSDSRSPETSAALGEVRGMLEASVDGLADDFREVFVLRAIEGMSTREISELLDVPEGTVKTRFFRARKALREDIERRLEAPLSAAFQFDGERCDRIVATVMARVLGS